MTLGLFDVAFVGSLGALWTPAAISTALWLDAADAGTVTTVSGAVSEWRDKSGNLRHFTQATAASRPAYTSANGLNVLSFNGTATLVNNTAALFRNISGGAVFLVCQSSTSRTFDQVILFVSTPTNATRSVVRFSASNGLAAGGRRLNTDAFQATTAAAYTGNPIIASALFDYANASLSVLQNGSQIESRAFQTAGSTSNDDGAAFIGSAGTPQTWTGTICEIIVIQTLPTTNTRQRIEGYLAHKWGLAANLPSDHPYKTSPPLL